MQAFYLGTHMPSWLRLVRRVPLFISHRRLAARLESGKPLPKAETFWALDSGGFSELSLYGEWRTTPEQYVEAVRRYDNEIGELDWAAPQDWMCEPAMLARTGLTVLEHQRRTVDNFVVLRDLWARYEDSDCPFMPVLQGQTITDYFNCAEMFTDAGVWLPVETDEYYDEGVVGVGSVCRRQSETEVAEIFAALRGEGFRLHGFGVKTRGLELGGHHLCSADSMAWSFRGRHLPGCDPSTHSSEANCMSFALAWHGRVIDAAVRRTRRAA